VPREKPLLLTTTRTRARSTRLAPSLPYVLLGLVLFALMLAQTLNRQWSSDYWVHQATIETFRHHLINPPNELTHSNDPSFSYTPYTFVLALFARITGLSSLAVLQLAALVNLAIFLVTFHLFVTELTRRRLASFFALLATLIMWGYSPWRWSGFLNLNSIGFGLPYPSMFATAVAFAVGWAFLRYIARGARWWVAGIGAGMVAIALTHPFTAVWTAVMLLALLIGRRVFTAARLVPLAIAAAIGIVVIAIWPYYSFFDLMRQGGDFSGVHEALYRDIPLRLLAVLPGFYIVFRRRQRDHLDPLALMLIAGIVLYAYGGIANDHGFGRVLPLVLLPAHVGIAIVLSDWVERRARASAGTATAATSPNPVLVGWIAVSAVIGLIGVLPGLARTIPRPLLPDSIRSRAAYQPITHRYAHLAGALPDGTIIVAENPNLGYVAAGFGLGTVAPPPGRPVPFVPDVAARKRDARVFLDQRTTNTQRDAIAARYDVGGVMCQRAACVEHFTAPAAGGRVVARGPSWTLIDLREG
jgi:alpha-1,6-mannosyltransferase